MLRAHLDRGKVHALAFSPDGRTLAAATGHGVALVDVAAGRVVGWLKPMATAARPHAIRFGVERLDVAIGASQELRYDLPAGTGRRHALRTPPLATATAWWVAAPTPLIGTDPPTAWVLGWLNGSASTPEFGLLLCGADDQLLPHGPVLVPWPSLAPPLAGWRRPDGLLVAAAAGRLVVLAAPPPAAPPPPLTFWQRAGLVLRPPVTEPDAARYIVAAVQPLPAGVVGIAPLPDGETVLLAAGRDLVLWHPAGDRVRWRWPPIQHPRAVAVSPDGLLAAAGDAQGRLVVWDLD